MNERSRGRADASEEVERLRRRLAEAEDTIQALVRGEVDAVRPAEGGRAPVLLESAQAALRTSEAQYRALFQSNPLPILILDARTGRFLAVNEAARRHYGWSEDEFLAMDAAEIRPPEDVEPFWRYVKDAPTEPTTTTWRHLKADGSEFLAEITTRGTTFRGTPARLAIVKDVTESRRAERERDRLLVREQEARAEAEAAHQRLTDILESITDAFLACDDSWRFTYVNGGGERLVGRFRDDLLGEELWEAFPGFRGTEWERALRRAVESGEPTSVEERIPDDRWVRARAYPWRDGVAVYVQDITAVRRAERELDQFFNLSVDMLCVVSVDGVFRRVNPASEATLGRDPREVEGRSYRSLVHPEDLERTDGVVAGLREGRPVRGFENRYRARDGSWRWLSWTVTVPVDGLMYAVARDVTERKREEALAAGQQDVLEMIATGAGVDAVLGAVARLCREESPEMSCGLQAWDPGAGTLRHRAASGLPFELVAALDVTPGRGGGPAERVIRDGSACVATEPARDPRWARHRDEALHHGIHAAWHLPLHDPDGEPLGVLGLYAPEARSLTRHEQRALDVAVRLANIALTRHRSEERRRLLQQAVSQLSDMVLITEAEPLEEPGPRIVFVNEAFERLTGYRAEEVVGRTPLLLHGPKTDLEAQARIWERVRAGRAVQERMLNYTKDGREIWLELNIAPVVDAEGHVTHWVGVQRDVTERKALEQQLAHSQKMEAVGRLAGGIAHDFNNLLTVMLGSAQILLEEAGDEDGAKGDLEEIAEAARRATSLTRQLLAFGRKQMMNPRVVDLDGMVRGMLGMLRRLIGEDVTLDVELAGTPHAVRADAAQLEQVLLNLAVNARDAMEHGGRLRISTDETVLGPEEAERHPDAEPGAYAVLRVADTGHGMEPEVLDRIFEPFFTTKESGKGTGLGLATAFGIVQQSGGFIDVGSRPGEGTTFSVHLPAVESPVEAAEPRTRPGRRRGTETILVVEDDPAVRRFVRRALARFGYTVIEASGGEEALGVVLQCERRVDLVLTDVVMPRMSGVRLAERLAEEAPDLRVLFISGYSHDEVAGRGLGALNADLVDKPLSVHSLAVKVREVLERPPGPLRRSDGGRE
ncbi:MAG: PAS domain S-box protein [Myxococcota bacterium]